HVHVGQVVGEGGGALGGGGVSDGAAQEAADRVTGEHLQFLGRAVRQHLGDELGAHLREDRGGDDLVLPERDFAFGGDASFEHVVGGGAEDAVPHVVFARPYDLHRSADRLREKDRLGRVVLSDAPAEAASQQGLVNEHAIDGHAAHVGGDGLCRACTLSR